MTTWRDLAAGQQPDVPTPPSTGAPAPTPNWRSFDPADQQAPAGQQAPAPVPPPQAPASPGPAPAEQGAQAWQAAAGLGVGPATPAPTVPSSAPPGDTAEAGAELGMRLAASGAAATDVNTAELLQMIRGLQAQVEQLTATQNAATAPEVVKYATAFADHLQAKADAHPVINADPDHTYIPALQKAAQLVNAAENVAASGSGHDNLVTLAKDAAGWVRLHARKFPAIDYEYIAQLAEEVGSAAAKLLA